MKKITLLSVFLFGILACTSQKQEHTSQEKESTQLTQSPLESKNLKGLEESLKFLTSDELMGRDVGSEGLEKAAHYIQGVLKKNGIKPYLNKSYLNYFTVGEHKTSNVVGYLPGENPDLPPLIIGAHYDHIGIVKAVDGDEIANGANDN
ncbi:MAG: M28 family peptidase, partial [Psychroflexus halocasei]